jgi:DNA replication initiation complex subunit (GINS family)
VAIAAFSPRESREEKESHVEDEIEQPDETEQPDEDTTPEQFDEDYEARSNQQSSTRKQHSRAVKDKGNPRIKHMVSKETTEQQCLQMFPKTNPPTQPRPTNTNNAPRPNHPDLPTSPTAMEKKQFL